MFNWELHKYKLSNFSATNPLVGFLVFQEVSYPLEQYDLLFVTWNIFIIYQSL